MNTKVQHRSVRLRELTYTRLRIPNDFNKFQALYVCHLPFAGHLSANLENAMLD